MLSALSITLTISYFNDIDFTDSLMTWLIQHNICFKCERIHNGANSVEVSLTIETNSIENLSKVTNFMQFLQERK